MGEVVEGGVGVANKTSPRRAAIEKVQADLRQEYDVREERKRELEFLENGGNPLDFNLGNAASVSVQSTSFTDQHPDLFATSEAKVSFAFTASPHGDSVESSGRPGAPPFEPNSADNLMLFDAEHEFYEGDPTSLHPSKSYIAPSEQSSQMDTTHKAIEHGDSAAFGFPRKAYKRRYRSRPNHDGTRSSSTDVNATCASHGSSLPYSHVPVPGDIKGLVSDSEIQNTSLNCISKPPSPVSSTLCKTVFIDAQREIALDGVKAVESTEDLIEGISRHAASDDIASKNPLDNQHSQHSPSDAAKTPMKMDSPEAILPVEEMTSTIINPQPSVAVVNQSSYCRMNGFNSIDGDGMAYNAHNSASRVIKGLDSDLSCTQNSPNIDGKNNRQVCIKTGNVDSNVNIKNQILVPLGAPVKDDEVVEEKKETEDVEGYALVNEETPACESQQKNGFVLQPQEEQKGSTSKNEVMDQVKIEEMEAAGTHGSESGRKPTAPLGDYSVMDNENSGNISHQSSIDISVSYLPEVASVARVSSDSLEAQTSSEPNSKLGSRNDEDSILKEALIIEAKRKRIMELSCATFPLEIRRKSQWDYVLEEMAWLANDFAQERVWKIAAAAQICYRATFDSRMRREKKEFGMEARKVAHTLAKAVIGFWHSVEETSKELEQPSQKDGAFTILAYAERFLKFNNSNVLHSQAEVPLTPDRISDLGILDMSWEDNLTDENLFYTVSPGAMGTYRKSIESHVTQCERIGRSMQEQVGTSACDAAADLESKDDVYDEDEGEISTYGVSIAFEGSDKSSRFGQKKRKKLTNAYGAMSSEIGSHEMAMQYADIKVVARPPLLVKRPGSVNVSIPTKRMRTASRRVISPFSAGPSGCIQGLNKTDASSGDTSSFQDDPSTLRDGSLHPDCLEAEFVGDFEKPLPFDSAEVSTKLKKKKPKLLNAAYKHRWQVDSSFQNEQFPRDHLKKGSEGYQLESNGNSGLLGQPLIKKPKMRQSHDSSFNNITPIGGSITSPVASQMSNMSNPNKIVKVVGGRDRGRKPKVLKMPAGQPGSGSPWSLFEDQALVVLVHDMGPNWELISDAMNSTLHFKSIFRKPKECKDRHHVLMDGTSGDGADSAEDSGSSQPYPSTLPGIPKGSARQLFQRLQGPMEEDTINSHFDKIIMIGQKQHFRKTQDPKQLQQPHSSHAIALSQVCPNNLNGGPIVTPLELCDDAIAGQDIHSLGYHGTHSGVLANPNQGNSSQMLPASGASSALQGSLNMMLGHNSQASPGSLNSSVRDGRYGVPRSASISIEEQQRVQQYGQMMSGRNIPQHNMSAPGSLPGTDRGVRILPGGNGLGIVSGVNRSIPLARPGFQAIASSSMVNSGSMASPGMASTNIHSGLVSGQGSSLLRPNEALHMTRPGMSQDSQRPMMVSDLQMQVSPGNSQGMSHFGGLSSPFPYPTASPSVSSYPLHHQQSHPISPQQPQVLSPHHSHFQGTANHGPNPQQQAYAIHLAKERQLRQRFLQQHPQQQQQQQQQFAASNSLMPHVQSQTQLPVSSPTQNNSQVQSQANSPPVSLSPLTSTSSMNSIPQHQQKHHTPTQGGVRNSQTSGSGLTNQSGKQRQRQQQQLSQANRQHPQQRQQSQSQQQAKVLKGVGRGNLMLHQNIPIDSSILNGVSTISGNQSSEKGEPATHLMQSRSTLNAVQPTRQYMSSQSSNQSQPQQKVYSGQASSSSKLLHQMTSHADSSSQGHVSAVAPTGLSATQQSVPSMAMAGSNHQQAPPHQKFGNPNHSSLQRVVQPNRQITDPSNKPRAGEFETDKNPTVRSTEISTMGKMDSNPLNSETNLNSLVSTVTNSSETHDVTAQWQQQPLHVQQSQSPVLQPQHPLPQQQQTLLPLHSQQQGQLLQAGNGNLFGRSGDSRLE